MPKTYRDIALLAAEWLGAATSSDGSGHADLARNIYRMVAQVDGLSGKVVQTHYQTAAPLIAPRGVVSNRGGLLPTEDIASSNTKRRPAILARLKG